MFWWMKFPLLMYNIYVWIEWAHTGQSNDRQRSRGWITNTEWHSVWYDENRTTKRERSVFNSKRSTARNCRNKLRFQMLYSYVFFFIQQNYYKWWMKSWMASLSDSIWFDLTSIDPQMHIEMINSKLLSLQNTKDKQKIQMKWINLIEMWLICWLSNISNEGGWCFGQTCIHICHSLSCQKMRWLADVCNIAGSLHLLLLLMTFSANSRTSALVYREPIYQTKQKLDHRRFIHLQLPYMFFFHFVLIFSYLFYVKQK